MILKTLYPVRQVRGFGHLENKKVSLRAKNPPRLHILSETEYIVLFHCNGARTIAEITQLIEATHPELSEHDTQQDVSKILHGLERNLLITLCTEQSNSVPSVRVQFRHFWPGFNPKKNCFLRLMSRDILAIVTHHDAPDISFESTYVTNEQPENVPENETIRVFVSDGKTEPDFDVFDYAFSPFDVKRDFVHCHSQVAYEDYSDIGHNRLKSAVKSKFFDFLFPIDVRQLSFDFTNSTEKEFDDGLEIEAAPVTHPQTNDALSTASPPYHVCLTTNLAHSDGMFALVNSILVNTKTPEKFFFHILVDGNNRYFENILAAMGIESQYEVVSFTDNARYREYTEFLKANIRVNQGTRQRGRIKNMMNFSRFYLPDIFSNVDVSLYLDVDMIVQVDLAPIFDIDLSSAIIAAPLSRPLERYSKYLNLTNLGFNAGVLLMNFALWREKNVIGAIKKVMVLHKQRRLFPDGTQPILNTVFYQQCVDLDARWNVTGLGNITDLDPQLLDSAWILHWTGRQKPWLEDGLYKQYWDRYRIPV